MGGHIDSAIAALAEVATNGQSEAARVSAAIAILDRAYGRPTQAVALNNIPQVEMPTTIIIRGVSPDDLSDN
jgi:hypothetical protein